MTLKIIQIIMVALLVNLAKSSSINPQKDGEMSSSGNGLEMELGRLTTSTPPNFPVASNREIRSPHFSRNLASPVFYSPESSEEDIIVDRGSLDNFIAMLTAQMNSGRFQVESEESEDGFSYEDEPLPLFRSHHPHFSDMGKAEEEEEEQQEKRHIHKLDGEKGEDIRGAYINDDLDISGFETSPPVSLMSHKGHGLENVKKYDPNPMKFRFGAFRGFRSGGLGGQKEKKRYLTPLKYHFGGGYANGGRKPFGRRRTFGRRHF